jgi:hypothetical protein
MIYERTYFLEFAGFPHPVIVTGLTDPVDIRHLKEKYADAAFFSVKTLRRLDEEIPGGIAAIEREGWLRLCEIKALFGGQIVKIERG